jgi:hypothetical protein
MVGREKVFRFILHSEDSLDLLVGFMIPLSLENLMSIMVVVTEKVYLRCPGENFYTGFRSMESYIQGGI